MRVVLLAGILVASSYAADDLSPLAASEPPKCEKATRTRFWPDEANTDARTAVRLAREGKLLICTRGAWRYQWRSMSLNLRAAVEQAKEKQ